MKPDPLLDHIYNTVNAESADILQTAGEWAYSFPGITKAKVRGRLDKLAKAGRIRVIEHRGNVKYYGPIK